MAEGGAKGMLSADQAALYLLGKGKETDERLSHLKLQKLLYFAQCATLAETGEPLFTDPINAWKHGPVVKSVFKKYTGSGAKPLPRPKRDEIPCLDATTARRLDAVYAYFGQYSAWKLRNITHEESGWEANHKSGKPYSLNVMRDEYVARWQEKVRMSLMTYEEWDAFLNPPRPSQQALMVASSYMASRRPTVASGG